MTPTGDRTAVEVAQMFEEVARALAGHRDVDSTLSAITVLAVEHVDACELAGISMVKGRAISTPVATDEVAMRVDAIQAEVDEGPCLDAIATHQVFRTGDLAGEQRWPRFAARAHRETGISSILSFRLFVDGRTMGALNLYATASDAFGDADVAIGSVFAAHASVALSGAEREAQLESKATSRELIGKAKGMLMAQSGIDDDAAFDLLRRASQRLNVKLTTVAEGIVHPDRPHAEPDTPDAPHEG